MTFVNEYVSEENIRKYNLDKLMAIYYYLNDFVWEEEILNCSLDELIAKFDQLGWKTLGGPGFRFAWTIDRERNLYFMRVFDVRKTGRSGREEPSGTSIYILNINGARHEVYLAHAPGSSVYTYENPFRIIWDLKKPLDDSSIISVLKDALLVYGSDGIKGRIQNPIVEFNF